jgi:hypothetical protein
MPRIAIDIMELPCASTNAGKINSSSARIIRYSTGYSMRHAIKKLTYLCLGRLEPDLRHNIKTEAIMAGAIRNIYQAASRSSLEKDNLLPPAFVVASSV